VRPRKGETVGAFLHRAQTSQIPTIVRQAIDRLIARREREVRRGKFRRKDLEALR
jgi:hypothetical protein